MNKDSELDKEFLKKLEELLEEYGIKGIMYNMRIKNLPPRWDPNVLIDSLTGGNAIINSCWFEYSDYGENDK